MIEFCAKIAGYTIAFMTLYPETKELFKDYLTEETPLFTIASGKDKIIAEREFLKQSIGHNCLSFDRFSESRMESNYLYRETAEQLSKYRIILIHGSAVSMDGAAYVFVAPSGIGKSTHTGLWREVFGTRAVMINDDKPLLKCGDDGIYVCGSPWNGKHKLGTNVIVPLKSVCFLVRGAVNQVEKVTEKEAFLWLLKAVYHSKEAEYEENILQSLQCVLQKTTFCRLRCNMELEAAMASYECMRNDPST